MKACVIFDTRYGNTERVAKSFEAGLKRAGIQTTCLNEKDVAVDSLRDYDLICVGAPTEWMSASRSMKDFLRRLRGTALSGKYGFAFDTRFNRRLSGSAAKLIEKELKRLGLEIIAPSESAKVASAKGVAGAKLEEGESERFESIGFQVGEAWARLAVAAH